MKKRINILGLILGLFFTSTSCEDILEPVLQGQLELSELFKTEDNAITAINGMYNILDDQYADDMSRMSGMASDDAWTWRNELETDIYIVEASYAQSRNFWNNAYVMIGRTNIVLAGIPDVPWSNSQLRDYAEGQAKFLRALTYFNLVRFFGDVPLIVNSLELAEDAAVPRAPQAEVYAQIESDLSDAIELLPTSYSGGSGLEVGRVTKYASQMVKAYVHLELEEWEEAANLALNLLASGSQLPYVDNFNGTSENSPGTFFEVQYDGNNATGTGSFQNEWFLPQEFNGFAWVLPTDDNLNGLGGGPSSGNGIVQAYEAGDIRFDVTLSNYGLGNFIDPTQPDGSLFYVNKFYNSGSLPDQSPWNFPVYRYSDALLVAAEALNEQSYATDGPAFDHLNAVRNNAGLTDLTSADLPDQASFRTAVRDERRVEFAFEFKRYFDLNRWGILEATLQNQLSLIGLTFPSAKVTTHPITGKPFYLYPIPDMEFENNPNLGEQNPGYN